MKKLLFLLLLLPSVIFAQTDSWVKFAVQYDYWAPQESAFTFVSNANGDTVLYHQPTTPWEYLDTIVDCNSGPYTITLNDSYGDGWGSYQSGNLMSPFPEFKMQNDCQGMIFYADSTSLLGFSTLDTLVNINPCAPPVSGCTDTNATNYDSLATIEDGTCIYPACNGILTSNAYEICINNGTQNQIVFEWTVDSYNPSCEVANVIISNEEGLGPFYFSAPGASNFGFQAGNGQMPPNWSVEHYCQLEFADGSLSDTIAFTPSPCIAGCTDPTQISYNPWATSDDGSCSGTNCDTATQYQITIEIMLDNWPGETSWQFVDGLGNTFDYPVGTYDFQDIGQVYTYNFCVDQNAQFEMIINDDFGDGMAGSTSGGTMDGAITIYDCSGDTIWYMDNPGFGSVLYSGPQNATPCPTVPQILGCMDDDYQEFNPLANVDDSSCTNLHIYGCTDTAAFNYDATATMMDLTPDCNYELWIGDAGGDGWGNSYLGIMQGGNILGTFTMGPGNYQQTFNIILDPGVPVEVYYFEVGGPQQPPQEVEFQTWHNSFKLTNSDGFELMYEGYNPFANNGQGALQNFDSPFWTKYVAVPFCGNTCIPVILGCMDSTAANYDSLANTDDGNCIPIIYGCTNEFALNYDSTATVDDNTCIAIVNGCMDTAGYNYNSLANVDDGSCIYLGCTDVTACNYDAIANVDNGGCTYPIQYYDCYGACLSDTDGDGICDSLEIPGCTDPLSTNFNPLATDDDGNCIPYVYGCTDSTMYNYSVTANTDDGSCIPYIYGCTDPSAFNYDVLANTNDSSCIPVIIGCMDNTMFNYDPLANTSSGNCQPFVYGCMDSTAFNYDPLANTDNGTCQVVIYGCTNPIALNYDPIANTDDLSCILPIYGCTDSTMFNYNPLANTDNGTCIPFIYGCTNANALNYDATANTDDGTCILPIYGCTDSTMWNYNPLANVDNGSCEPFIYGCNDATALNYNPLANTSDNTCCYISGCTDSTALNYDPNACFDDNSCITIITGCTDVGAYNYNPLANVSDSTACLYDAGCYGGPGIPYWLNDGCYAWVIDVDDYCCTNDWDASCQSMYDYCQQGWPVSVDELAGSGTIVVYPNPSEDIFNIDTRLDIEVEIYDLTGRAIIKSKDKRISLAGYPSGVYNMIIIHNELRFNKRVIKQ